MPIADIDCPQCGATVTFGVPQGATVRSVSNEGAKTDLTERIVRCPNGHDVVVRFER